MALSAVSNAVLDKGHIPHQKTGTDTKQIEKGNSNPSPENNLSGNKFDDNVTLTRPEKTNAPSKVIDEKAAEELLPQVMKSILAHSKTAISAQANNNPQTASGLVTDN